MLYESTYNQYFLEHSWGPWKKHLYISRDGESGKYTYKYPNEYYDKYKSYKRTTEASAKGALTRGDTGRAYELGQKVAYNADRSADQNADYYNEYYDTNIDKIINRSVKKAVDALNFGAELKGKAEGYLNRFANAVANAWNSAKSPDRTRLQAGKQFVSNMWNYTKNTITAKRISASVQNLVKGAGEAVKRGWKETKKKAGNAARKVKNTATSVGNRVTNAVRGARARSQGAELV